MMLPRLALATLVLLALLAACKKAEEPVTQAPVTVATVELHELDEAIEATGQLVATNHAEVSAEVAGRVTAILLDEGSPVEAGGVVLEIDTERRQLDLDASRGRLAEGQATLIEAEREVRRVNQLKQSDFASRARLEQSQTAAAAARARVTAATADTGLAERALRDARVTAPFAGTLGERHVSRGEFVNAGQKLFELVSLDPIEVEFHLAEVDSGRVRLGQSVHVRVAPFPDEEFDGKVMIVSPTIDPRTRTLRVRASMANPQGRLRPGLFARADLGVARRSGVLMIPEEAMLQRADGSVVFRLDGEGRAERRRIKTGAFRDGSVEVLEGLQAGDLVVTRGHSDLVDGSVVVARNPDGSELVVPVASGKREPEARP